MVELLPSLVSVLTALGIGSLLGTWVAGAKDRRAARADVAGALSVLEKKRFSDPDSDDLEEFREARRRLQTRALTANIPQEPVRVYLRAADFSHRVTSHAVYPVPGVRDSRPMSMDEAREIVSESLSAAWLLGGLVWSGPVTRRWKGRRFWSPSRRVENRLTRAMPEPWQDEWRRAGRII